jgi:hypothetical protein
MVGHTNGWLAVLHRFGDQFVKARRAVKHREFGVNVEVGEGIGHSACWVPFLGGFQRDYRAGI